MEDIVFDDAYDGADSVPPADFFSFFVSASIVGNRNFVDGYPEFGDFCGDFRFEAEAVLLDCDLGENLFPKHLVASLHIGEIEVGEHIGKLSEQLVSKIVPVIEDAVHARA